MKLINLKAVHLALPVCLTILMSIAYLSSFGFAQWSQESSAAYVRFVCGAMVILSLIQITLTLSDSSLMPIARVSHKSLSLVFFIIVVLYGAVIETLGFVFSSAIFLPLCSWLLGYKNWKTIVASSIGIIGFVLMLFEQVLGVMLPAFVWPLS